MRHPHDIRVSPVVYLPSVSVQYRSPQVSAFGTPLRHLVQVEIAPVGEVDLVFGCGGCGGCGECARVGGIEGHFFLSF